MTPEEHNKTLGILHIVYAALHTLLMLGVFGLMIFFLRVAGDELRNQPDTPPEAFLVTFVIVGGLFALLLTVPSYVAGYAMLKRKPWGRVATLVAAIVEVLNVPFGTALGIYALWFLFGKGQVLYQGDALTPDPRPPLNAARAGRIEHHRLEAAELL
ncbi:MAG TPA: hypothetical protein VIP46_16400, partial [Pyrinomonadaceae bacterium]